jgi:hypothetical protein
MDSKVLYYWAIMILLIRNLVNPMLEETINESFQYQ